jgi:UDP-N-acetylmuramate--alanine ligase
MCRAVRQRGKVEPVFVQENTALFNDLDNLIIDGDILLMQGAGNIGALSAQLYEQKGISSTTTAT